MKSTARKLSSISHHPKYSRHSKYHLNGKKALRRIYSKPINDIKNKSKELKINVVRYTARKPLRTLGIVTAVSVFSGFLLGYLSSKK